MQNSISVDENWGGTHKCKVCFILFTFFSYFFLVWIDQSYVEINIKCALELSHI